MRLLAPKATAFAHCDLPCGVYDPAQARIEAESVKAICEKYQQNSDAEFRTRAIDIKEERSDLVKHHLWVLWTDYFKPPHFEKYPQLHQLFNDATKIAGAPQAPRAAPTRPPPTPCSPRSRTSPRSSGRPSKAEHTRRRGSHVGSDERGEQRLGRVRQRRRTRVRLGQAGGSLRSLRRRRPVVAVRKPG